MRIKNIPITLTFRIPYNEPDLNGTIYTKEAIIKALEKNSTSNLPIIFQGQDEKINILGNTINDISYTDCPEKQCIYMYIKGRIKFCGTCCQVNEFHIDKNSNDKDQIVVDDFIINRIGFAT